MSIEFNKIPSPCYVLDQKLLFNNLKLLSQIQKKSHAKIICALKGFAMFSTFKLVKDHLFGTTASSLHEAKLGYEEFGKEVHAYCVAYIPNDFKDIISYCNHITFNSLKEWKRYKYIISTDKKSISCGIRINPEYAKIETDLYNPCVLGSRLGVTSDALGENLPKGIEGLHFHAFVRK